MMSACKDREFLFFWQIGKKFNVPYLATSAVDGATEYMSLKSNNTEIIKLFSLFIIKILPQ